MTSRYITNKTFNPSDVIFPEEEGTAGLSVTQVNSLIDTKQSIILGGVPSANLDTIKEISDSLGEFSDFKGYVDTQLSNLSGESAILANNNSFTGTNTFQNTVTFNSEPVGLTKSAVGLTNVDNTSDSNKPVSSDQQTALNTKMNLAGGNTVSGLQTFNDNVKISGDIVTADDTTIANATLNKINLISGLTTDAQNQINNRLLVSGGNSIYGTQTFFANITAKSSLVCDDGTNPVVTIPNTTLQKIEHLSTVSSDVQTQINSKPNLSTANTYSGINTYNNDLNINGDLRVDTSIFNTSTITGGTSYDRLQVTQQLIKLNGEVECGDLNVKGDFIHTGSHLSAYNSPWTAVSGNNAYTFTHNLTLLLPFKYSLYFIKDNADVASLGIFGFVGKLSNWSPLGEAANLLPGSTSSTGSYPSTLISDITGCHKVAGNNCGYVMQIVNTQTLKIRFSNLICEVMTGDGNSFEVNSSGYVKLCIWK